MTFLELCKRVHERSGMSGSGPIDVTNQAQSLMKLVGWVQDADIEIQALKGQWKFLWRRSLTSLTLGKYFYTAGELGLTNPKAIVKLSIAGRGLTQIDWDKWTAEIEPIYDSGLLDGGEPVTFTQDPQGNYHFYPVPNSAYSIKTDYYIAPARLVVATDVTPIPDDHQDTIVQRALMTYAKFEEDGDLYNMANRDYEEKLTKLCNEQLPKMG